MKQLSVTIEARDEEGLMIELQQILEGMQKGYLAGCGWDITDLEQ